MWENKIITTSTIRLCHSGAEFSVTALMASSSEKVVWVLVLILPQAQMCSKLMEPYQMVAN